MLDYIKISQKKELNWSSLYTFGGMSLQLLLIEAQDRYSYPLSWIFIILAMTAFNPKENEEALDYD